MRCLNDKIGKRIAQAPRVFFFLDYDGTLTPIVARPGMASLSRDQREILLELSKQRNVRIGVISGRTLEDVKKRIGISGIIYAGNHGLELERVKTKRVHPAAIAFRQLIKKLIPRLELAFSVFPEILVEDKTFSISVHYRQLPEDKIEFARMLLLKEVGIFLSRSQIVLAEGKKVWEIRPPTEWNKGKTVLWLLGNLSGHSQKATLPVYIGDDVTDEDAFKAIGNHGITIRVTNVPSEHSKAEYFLCSSDEVYDFFKKIIRIRQGKDF
ncbi:MAG: trehalose-phosphatase [Candidatus Omnitrophica bacterium]|nr:trehalose-phosphatase [Candidatus Omnitrophota bacterium]